MEKEKTNNEGAQPQPVDNINLSIGGEIRNYQVEHLSDDAKNKLARVNQDEVQVLPLIQRIFTLAALVQELKLKLWKNHYLISMKL